MAGMHNGLLARLLGKREQRVTSPLSSFRLATRWIADMPMGDVLKSQETFAAEFKRFNDNAKAPTAERLAAFMLLDEKSRELQQSLIRQYLRNTRMQREVESRLWHSVYALTWEMVRGYRAFVMNFARSSGRCGYESEIPLIALRAMLQFGLVMKWRAFRYLAPGDKLWQRLHSLYQVVESENLHRIPVAPYAECKVKITLETAYCNVLMLDLVNTGTFYPRQTDLIDRWLTTWNCAFRLDPGYAPATHGFVVDLGTDHGPRRARNPDANAAKRYWNAEPVLTKLRAAQEAIREGAAPASIGLTEDLRTAECQGLIEHLLRLWSPSAGREQRRSPRVESKRMVELAHGFPAVIDQLKGLVPEHDPYQTDTYNETQDLQVYGFVTQRTREQASEMNDLVHASRVERWIMQNESARGYGTSVESTGRDWLRVGELVAIRPREEKLWRVGIIRRLSRTGGDSSSVGIETLADGARSVHLLDGQTNGYTVVGDGYSEPVQHRDAVLLSQADTEPSLLLDPVHFQPGRLWQVTGVADTPRIRLTQALQHGDGWMQVRFEAA